jgi:hypothetical protein
MKNSSTAGPLRFLLWMALLGSVGAYAGCGSSGSGTAPPSTNPDSNWDSMTWDESDWG